MLGTLQLGTYQLGTAAGAIVLLPVDASLLILRPRHTLYALAARQTVHRLPHRNTADELGARVKLHRIPHRNTVDDGGPT